MPHATPASAAAPGPPGPGANLPAGPKAGLLGSTALTPPAVAAQGPVEQPIAVPEEEPNVSEEEQGQYDELVGNCYQLLYSDMATTLKSIAGAGDPVTGIAETVSSTLSRCTDSATKAGLQLPDEVVFNAGDEILGDMFDLASTAKIHEFTQDEMDNAAYLTAELYRSKQQEGGNIDPNQAAADLEFLQTAEEEGSLDDLLPDRLGGGIEDAVPEPTAKPPPSPLSRSGLVA